ncbi:hypothetical protein MHN84_20400 [Mycobacterium sp. PSTR-4-N]|nr:hypothetical protein [Mycobacterium sp. PSTR-4-N]
MKQNNENLAGPYRNCKAGLRGVYLQDGRWRAQVYHHSRKYHVGYFATAEEAGEAARLKRLELFTHNEIDKRETAHV